MQTDRQDSVIIRDGRLTHSQKHKSSQLLFNFTTECNSQV